MKKQMYTTERWYTGPTIHNGNCGYHALAEAFVRVLADNPDDINNEFFNQNNAFFKPAQQYLTHSLKLSEPLTKEALRKKFGTAWEELKLSTHEIAKKVAPAFLLLNIEQLKALKPINLQVEYNYPKILQDAFSGNCADEKLIAEKMHQDFLNFIHAVSAADGQKMEDYLQSLPDYLKELNKDNPSFTLICAGIENNFTKTESPHPPVELSYLQLLSKLIFKPINNSLPRVFVGTQQQMQDSPEDINGDMAYAVIMPPSNNSEPNHFEYAFRWDKRAYREPNQNCAPEDKVSLYEYQKSPAFEVRRYLSANLSTEDLESIRTPGSYGFAIPPSSSSSLDIQHENESIVTKSPASDSSVASGSGPSTHPPAISSLVSSSRPTTPTNQSIVKSNITGSVIHPDAVSELFELFEAQANPNKTKSKQSTPNSKKKYTIGSLTVENTSTASKASIQIEKNYNIPSEKEMEKIEKDTIDCCLACFIKPRVDIDFTLSTKKDIERLRDFIKMMTTTPEPAFHFNLKNSGAGQGENAIKLLIEGLHRATSTNSKDNIIDMLDTAINAYPNSVARAPSLTNQSPPFSNGSTPNLRQ